MSSKQVKINGGLHSSISEIPNHCDKEGVAGLSAFMSTVDSTYKWPNYDCLNVQRNYYSKLLASLKIKHINKQSSTQPQTAYSLHESMLQANVDKFTEGTTLSQSGTK